jgi:hypothetical protein
MHYTIGAIVYAPDAAEARSSAEGAFERISGEHGPFDYFTIFKDGVKRANSKTGKAAIDELMGWTREEFIENMAKLREALSRFSDEGAFSMAAEFDLRYRAYQIGRFSGPGVTLYDIHGGGIRNPEMLEAVLTKTDIEGPVGVLDWTPGKRPIAEDAWIVLADVHS